MIDIDRCRGCLEKVHEIARGHELTGEEKRDVLGVIEKWLRQFVA